MVKLCFIFLANNFSRGVYRIILKLSKCGEENQKEGIGKREKWSEGGSIPPLLFILLLPFFFPFLLLPFPFFSSPPLFPRPSFLCFPYVNLLQFFFFIVNHYVLGSEYYKYTMQCCMKKNLTCIEVPGNFFSYFYLDIFCL